MIIPDPQTDRAGALALIRAINPSANAEGILDRGGQYNDYVRDIQKELSKLLTGNKAGAVAGYLNAIASTKADMTPERKEAERQATLKALGGESELIREVTRDANLMKALEPFLSAEEMSTYNTFLDNAKQVSPSFITDAYKFTNVGKSSTTTGTTGTTTTTGSVRTDPTSFTGWMKYAYDQAIATGKDPGDFMSANIQGSTVHQASLQSIKDALKAGGWVAGTVGVTGTTGTGTTGGTTGNAASIQAAIDYINSQDLPADLKSLYITTVQNWDPTVELNIENIISTFNKIKTETIDPRFQGLANLAIESLNVAKTAQDKQRAIELETQEANQLGDIKGTQAGLEAAGLTFSGVGMEALGTGLSAVVPFGGQNIEGLVPKKHRLIATSSEATFQQNLKNMGLAAEETLGSSRVSGLVPGYAPVGSVVGSLTEDKQAVEGAALGNILNQQIDNKAQGEQIDFTSYV